MACLEVLLDLIGSIGNGALVLRNVRAPSSQQSRELSADDQKEVERLKRRDAEVRQHEQAHAAAGGQHAGAPHYDYATGPDGRKYAVGGEVGIDVTPVQGDPEATIAKMAQVKRAALAPAEPSGQDRRVAAKADARAAAARMELAELRREPSEGGEAVTASRGARAYASSAAPADEAPRPGSTIDIKSCSNCGSAHA